MASDPFFIAPPWWWNANVLSAPTITTTSTITAVAAVVTTITATTTATISATLLQLPLVLFVYYSNKKEVRNLLVIRWLHDKFIKFIKLIIGGISVSTSLYSLIL